MALTVKIRGDGATAADAPLSHFLRAVGDIESGESRTMGLGGGHGRDVGPRQLRVTQSHQYKKDCRGPLLARPTYLGHGGCRVGGFGEEASGWWS